MADERFLVTGALGCIGAWTCALLAEEGVEVVGFDYGTDDRRLRLATDATIPLVQGDIVDGEGLNRMFDEHGITHVIHLAALLLPQIKPNPPYGTAVNIGGTVNVLDAAKTRGIQVSYASSAAVYSSADDTGGAVSNDAIGHPTHFEATLVDQDRRGDHEIQKLPWRGNAREQTSCFLKAVVKKIDAGGRSIRSANS